MFFNSGTEICLEWPAEQTFGQVQGRLTDRLHEAFGLLLLGVDRRTGSHVLTVNLTNEVVSSLASAVVKALLWGIYLLLGRY